MQSQWLASTLDQRGDKTQSLVMNFEVMWLPTRGINLEIWLRKAVDYRSHTIVIAHPLSAPRQDSGGRRRKFSPVQDWRSTPLEWLSITCDLDLDLDLESGHTAYHRASLVDLYVHTKFHSNRRKNFFLGGLTAGTPPSSRSRDIKTRKKFKNPARTNLYSVL